MQAVDEELDQLEQLIAMQQQKLSLLRRKKQLQSEEFDRTDTSTKNEVEMGRIGEEVNSAMHPEGNSVRHVPETVPDDIGRESDYDYSEDEDRDSLADMKGSGSTGRNTLSYFNSSKTRANMKHMKGIVNPMNRMSYLSTELANERTLLAWIRTALAMFRTVFSFYNFEGINSFGDITQRICLILLTLTAGATLGNGFARFGVVFERIFDIDPNRKPLGRPSIKPYVGVLSFVFVAVMIAVLYRGWWVKV